MGESSAIMRDPSGGVRLRCVKAGYNPLDLGTDRRFVTFDSAWANSFRVRASGQLSGTDLGGTGQRYGEAEPGYLSRELEKIPAFVLETGANTAQQNPGAPSPLPAPDAECRPS